MAVILPDECSCSGKSPTYVPKMSSMSNDDLDCIELIYWSIYSGLTPPTELPDYATVQALFAPCSCWICMSPRQRRELIVARMIDMYPCWSQEEIRAIIRLIEAKTTPAQRSAALDCLRYGAIYTLNCDNYQNFRPG